jgi:hypothetical protein
MEPPSPPSPNPDRDARDELRLDAMLGTIQLHFNSPLEGVAAFEENRETLTLMYVRLSTFDEEGEENKDGKELLKSALKEWFADKKQQVRIRVEPKYVQVMCSRKNCPFKIYIGAVKTTVTRTLAPHEESESGSHSFLHTHVPLAWAGKESGFGVAEVLSDLKLVCKTHDVRFHAPPRLCFPKVSRTRWRSCVSTLRLTESPTTSGCGRTTRSSTLRGPPRLG